MTALDLSSSAAKVSTLTGNRQPSRSRRGTRIFLGFIFAFLILATESDAAIQLSRSEAARIGKRVWQNECGGTIAGLTSWNAGENFASLGIGHFIWYPQDVRGPFEESFPELVNFIAQRGGKLPEVAAANRTTGCPWKSRVEFLAANQSPAMKALHNFLAETVDLQADFLVQRLQKALPKMLAAATPSQRANIEKQFNRVTSSAQGCYALVDYVNFKGEGLLDSERYHGQGWGLFQVLEGMNGDKPGISAAEEFSRSARVVLTRRVQNSPPERHEVRWLAGWLQRVQGYAKG